MKFWPDANKIAKIIHNKTKYKIYMCLCTYEHKNRHNCYLEVYYTLNNTFFPELLWDLRYSIHFGSYQFTSLYG